jgi:hypothetical protein
MMVRSFETAIFYAIMLYYVLWIEYPKKCKDALQFLQWKLFDIDCKKMASISLKRFIEKVEEN